MAFINLKQFESNQDRKEFKVLPEGFYDVKIVKMEKAPIDIKGHKVFQMDVQDLKSKQEIRYTNILTVNENGEMHKYGGGMITKLIEVTGIEIPEAIDPVTGDVSKPLNLDLLPLLLKGKEFRTKVEVEVYGDKERNKLGAHWEFSAIEKAPLGATMVNL